MKLVDSGNEQRNGTSSPKSEQLLRAIFNSSGIGVAVLTTEARFLEVNKAFCSITGYSEAEILGLDCGAFVHPEDAAGLWQQIGQLLAGDIRTFVIEKRYVRKDGETVWVQNSVSVTRDADDRPVNVVAICQDITQRKQSEEAARHSQALLEAELADTKLLSELSAQLIEEGDEQALHEKLVDAVAAIMRSDFATMQMFYPERGLKGELHLLASRGLTPEGRKLWEWVRFDTGSTCGQALLTGKRAIASDVETSDFLAGTAGGAALLAAGIRAAQSTPLISRGGNFVGMISSHWCMPHTPSERDLRLLDILARQAAEMIERKRAGDELRRVNQDLEQFVHSAGHDLQEPLRTVKIYSELLRARCGQSLDGQSATYLRFMGSAATQMETLLHDLLEYTQIDKLPSPAKHAEADRALGNALANLGGALEEGKAAIGFDPLPAVCMDETHLTQLFQNLIGNAVKYRHPERACTVHVCAERQEACWQFSVRDNGIGIESQYFEKVFGLFTRLQGRSSHAGTGLGLAICKRIVERYHGRIWVESEPGKGSDFRFSLPV